MERSSNFLDEALGLDTQSTSSRSIRNHGRVLLIEDCVETSGAFVLHHIVKRSLPPSDSSGVVIFVAFSHPFSHYDRVLRKLGCNLTALRDGKRFLFFDMLMMKCTGHEEGKFGKCGLVELYGKIQKVVEAISGNQDSRTHITIVIDDFSLVEVAAYGSSNHCLDFLHYCHALTSEFGCSLVMLNHEDIYHDSEQVSSLLQMEYLANVLIKAEPLATGLAMDVHGQLTVVKRGIQDQVRSSSKINNFHFKVKENGLECFYPGRHT